MDRKSKLIIVFYVLLVIISVFFLYHKRSALVVLQQIKMIDFFVIGLFSFNTFLFLSIQFNVIIATFNIVLEAKEWFGLTVVNTMIGYYTPAKSGVIARGYYLKSQHDLGYANYFSILAGSYLINMLVASFMACSLSFFLYIFDTANSRIVLRVSFLFFILTGFGTGLLFCSNFPSIFKNENRVGNFLKKIILGLTLLINRQGVILKIISLQIVATLMMALKLYWSFQAIGCDVDIFKILVIQSLTVFSMVVAITPGNLGIKEGIIGLFALFLGVPVSQAFLAATVDRVVSMGVTFFLGIIFSNILFQKVKKK